jgi:hypothetical protein
MFNMSRGAALLMLASLSVPALADTITCESLDGRERFCSANTRGGVYLSTQLSRNGCHQGETWGYDRRGIWVSGGCRAQFQTGYGGSSNWHQDNGYYSDRDRSDTSDGAKAAIAIGAILGAVAIASAASKGNSNASNSSSAYQRGYDRGCNAGNSDRRAGRSMQYWRHASDYDSRSEQAFSSGYNQCFRN